jgi:RHS repeat-associated protein
VDGGLRLKDAKAGAGNLTGYDPNGTGTEGFHFGYEEGDEVTAIWRDLTGERVDLASGSEGRIASRDGAAFRYDTEGRRTEDDRFTYVWSWRGELAVVTVKDTWPAGVVSPYAGHQVRYGYDAMGRLLTRTHTGALPPGVTDDAQRPFVETREYLWDGDTLLSEVARAQDGAPRFRKSYVPGIELDHAPQVRVEVYAWDGQTVASERLFAYLRDEQGSVTGLVEEKPDATAADRAKPPLVARCLYDPYGQVHVEKGPEVYSASFDRLTTSLIRPDASPAQQAASATAAPGALRILLSSPADTTTLAGLVLERRLTDGTWGALTAQELALGRDPLRPEELLVLPLSGWERDTTFRVTLTPSFKDTAGRSVASDQRIELAVPLSGHVAFERVFPVAYDSASASADDLGGLIPGGLNTLFEGLWTDPVTGIAHARARWYDARNASFLSEDPEQDLDSPDLYAFVGNRPNEFNDPRGRWLDTALDVVSTGWDVFKAGKEYLTTGQVSSETKTDLLLDAAGLVLPGVTAGVLKAGAKALRMADRGIDAARAASRAANVGDEASHVFRGADRAADGARGAGRAVRAADDLADARKVVNGADDLGDARRVASGADHGADAGRAGRRAKGAGKGARRAEDAGGARRLDDGIGCFLSFAPETLVATESGLRRIDEVAPGDEVWAFDEETGERGLRKVSSTAFHLAEDGLLLTVGGETLRTTAKHPFFTAGGEWVEAAKLQVGQEVRSLGGELLRVEKVEKRDGRFAVFNFEVEGNHNYFVGEKGLLVHNGWKKGWNADPYWQTHMHTVYVGDDGYIGLTDDFARRRAEWRARGRDIAALRENIPGRLAGRGVEQIEIQAARARGEVVPLRQNNSIDPRRTDAKAAEMRKRGREYMRKFERKRGGC